MLEEIFKNPPSDNNSLVSALNSLQYTIEDVLSSKHLAKNNFVIYQAINKLLKTDISVLPHINKYKHELMETTLTKTLNNYKKNRFTRKTKPLLLNELITKILGVTDVMEISDLKNISKKLSINFIIINNISINNIDYIADNLFNKIIYYNVGICKKIFDETNTIIIGDRNDKINISVEVIGENNPLHKMILLETIDGKHYSELNNVFENFEDYFNMNWSDILDKRNKIINDEIVKNVVYFNADKHIKNRYNVDYKDLVNHVIDNITEKDNVDVILQLITDYINSHIKIHKNEIRSILAAELLKLKKTIEFDIINILNSSLPYVERTVLMSNALHKILKKINSFDLIYYKEQFFNQYNE